jgi:regulator of protease activity HflC (stomatin/prohibitin superfamily)
VKIRNILKTAIVLAMVGGITEGCTRAAPGEVGIKVNYYGQNRGVQDVTIKTGMIFFDPFTESVLTYPTYIQTKSWTRSTTEDSPVNEEITYNSSEGMTFTADISLSYHLVAEKVPSFYVKFRSDDLSTFTNGYLHNVTRDAFNETAGQYTTSELYGVKKDAVLQQVKDKVNAKVSEIGVVIDQFGYIGAPRPPQSIVDSINRKIKAIQDAQAAENKVAQVKAEAEQDIARAGGQAQANVILDKSLTPNLIQWRQLQLTEAAINKWDGRRPMVEGTSSGLLINVTPSQGK